MTTILAITLNLDWCSELQSALHTGSDNIKIDAVSTLMEAYARVEDTEPDLVIVAHAFTKLPEFEMILMLFATLNVRWLRVTDSMGSDGKADGSNRQSGSSGIFNIDVSHRVSATARHLKALIPPHRTRQRIETSHPLASQARSSDKILLLGASTGGMDALSSIFSKFSVNCPPTIVVQHTGENFGGGLVQSLDRVCPARVTSAENGMVLKPGMVCIAAGGRQHIQLSQSSRFNIRLQAGDPVSGHLPSIDVLFRSAICHAPSVVAGLLTGMGRDGAQGLLALRDAGAETFAQDEDTSVVYGMPRAAWEIGATGTRLPLDKIPPYVMQKCQNATTRNRHI